MKTYLKLLVCSLLSFTALAEETCTAPIPQAGEKSQEAKQETLPCGCSASARQ